MKQRRQILIAATSEADRMVEEEVSVAPARKESFVDVSRDIVCKLLWTTLGHSCALYYQDIGLLIRLTCSALSKPHTVTEQCNQGTQQTYSYHTWLP
jgi:hypothetical protein